MFLLPKGNPLAENVPISSCNPTSIEKLKNGKTATGAPCLTFHH